MTELVASIFAPTVATLNQRATAAFARGANGVEVRVDAFEGDPAALNAYLRAAADQSWIVTCRCEREGGRSRAAPAQRAQRIAAVARGTRARIDFEWSDWTSQPEVRATILAELGPRPGDRLILSTHNFDGPFENPRRIVQAILADPTGATAKVAYRVRHINESFTALDLMHDHGERVTAIAMGEDGLWSRLLARKLGGAICYASLEDESATASGQVSLSDMVERYRFDRMDPGTKVYGVVGEPVGHSLGPVLHNRWFSVYDINAVYLPLRVRPEGDGLAAFLDGCTRRPWLGVAGLSVTVPHKEAALRWLGDGADPLAAGVGAVNTLVFQADRVRGHNTDCYAAAASLVEALACKPSALVGSRVDVLGAGGAARAVLVGLREYGCLTTVYARSPERSGSLAREFDCESAPWDHRVRRRGDVVINCTSVGMWPDTDRSPLPPNALRGCRLVFDLIYNPPETRLMRDASAAGARAINGLDMFVRQAATQFELWTGVAADRSAEYRWIAGVSTGRSTERAE